jgi:hypothetical protein
MNKHVLGTAIICWSYFLSFVFAPILLFVDWKLSLFFYILSWPALCLGLTLGNKGMYNLIIKLLKALTTGETL